MKFLLIFILFFSTLYAHEKVTLQLKWLHQFQFAGYYAAKEKGFYDEVGLDVEIKERALKKNHIDQVIHGEAEYGVADSILFLYRAKDEPVVVVAPIFQHSPNVLISLKRSGLNSPHKLSNRDLVFYKKDTDGLGILAMLKTLNISPNIKRLKNKLDYTSLLNGEAEIFAGYLTNEPYYFKELGVEINIINPVDYGFDMYGDMLFTSLKEAQEHPKRVEKFRSATLKGWEYALNNKEEIIKLIIDKYSKRKSFEHLRYEANALDNIIQHNSTPLGTLDLGRVKYTLDTFKKFALIETSKNIEDYIFNNYYKKTVLSDFLTPKEKEYLEAKKTIKMCIDPDWMPFEKIEDGKHIGMSADYISIFQKDIGYPIETIIAKDWSESLEFGKQRKCDIFSLIMPTNERRDYLNFTTPYMSVPLVIATNLNELFISDITNVSNKSIGIIKGYAYGEILRDKYPNMQLVDVENLKDGLEKVKRGDLFGFIGTLATVGYQIQKSYVGELKIAGKFEETWDLGIGTRNDEPILNNIFNRAINKLSAKQKQEILNRWVSVNYDKEVNYDTVFKWVGALVLVFVTIILVVLFSNRRLNQEIQNRKKIQKELQEAKESADKASNYKSEFLANMSHEIRTPLNAILGFIDLLKNEELNKRSLEYINIIDSSSYSLLQIIEDILDFSKIESGKLDIDKIDFNSRAEFEVITHLFSAKCKEKNLNLSLIIDKNLPQTINTDPLRIKQIISNLLGNAIKFTPEGKNIEVSIEYANKLLRISVRDEGKGIEEDKLEHIFKSFSQEDSSTTREFGGTGLGLTISKELVRLLDGELKVRTKVGVGSEFYFYIPVGIGKDITTPEENSDNTSFDGKKVLLVEDNKANQMFIKVILKKLNLEFDIANDGLEAIEAFKNAKYDIILMDENMPNMSGIEATKEILSMQEQNNLEHTPIIALTANALKGDRERFLEAGMDEYLSKPVNMEQLSVIFKKFM